MELAFGDAAITGIRVLFLAHLISHLSSPWFRVWRQLQQQQQIG